MVLTTCDGACVCCDKHDFRFAHNSTCHGFSRFCNTWHMGRRICWFVLVMASVSILCLQMHTRFRQFLKFEEKSEISVQYLATYPLPTVTICNTNMFSRSLLKEVDIELLELSEQLLSGSLHQILRAVTHSVAENITQIYWEKVAEYETREKKILADHNVTSFSVDKWIMAKGWQLNNSHPILIDCWVGKKRCSTADFKPVLTPQGLCYSINHDPKQKFMQRSPGSESGFNLLLDIDQPDYTAYKLDSQKQFESGVKVLLHEYYDYLYTGTSLGPYIGIPPGVVGYISSQPLIRWVNTKDPWMTCESNELYPKQSCLGDCTASDTFAKCDCRLWFEAGKRPLCGVTRTTACLIYRETELNEAYQPVNSEPFCYLKCNYACTEKTYRYGASYTTLTSNNTMEIFMDYIDRKFLNGTFLRYGSPEYIKNNFISLKISFPQLAVKTVETAAALTVSAFISDLGGQLGLFAGISVVTMFELLEYPIVKFYSLFIMNQRVKNRSVNSPKDFGEDSSKKLRFSYSLSEYGERSDDRRRSSVIQSQDEINRLANQEAPTYSSIFLENHFPYEAGDETVYQF